MGIPTDQNNEETFGALKLINADIRQALSDESTSVRVQDLLDLYRRTEAALSAPEPSPLLAAASRFRDAFDASAERATDGRVLSPDEAAEMDEATERMIYASNTGSLAAALDALSDFESVVACA